MKVIIDDIYIQSESLPNSVKENILKIDEVNEVDLKLVWDPPWTPEKMSDEARASMGID